MAPAVGREPAVIEAGQLQIAKEQATARGMIEPAHDVQQGGLAAPGRTEQDNDFTAPDFQVNALQRVHLHFA